MARDFSQIVWDEQLEDDCRQLVRLAIREDLEQSFDWTTVSLVSHEGQGQAHLVAREAGVIAGLRVGQTVLEEMAPSVTWTALVKDGTQVEAGTPVAWLAGPARNLLTCERIILNFLGRLSGVATQTRAYVEAVAGAAQVYDTRKTTPGWRRLEKYAVHCGGGRNHRTGLFDAVLIKDNHLAVGAAASGRDKYSPAEAIELVRAHLREMLPEDEAAEMIVEVEVDTLDQLRQVLPARPDIVLLDNMLPAQLAEAVALRNAAQPEVQLEASGGVNLQTIAAIAASGVERISVGALTHGARSLDVGLDWS